MAGRRNAEGIPLAWIQKLARDKIEEARKQGRRADPMQAALEARREMLEIWHESKK